MGAIVDVVHLDRDELALIQSRYPRCVLFNLSRTNLRIQQYRVIIPDEDPYDDSYYNFLFDNSIAMSSRNFQSRFEYDDSFRQRIRARAEADPGSMKNSGGGEDPSAPATGG